MQEDHLSVTRDGLHGEQLLFGPEHCCGEDASKIDGGYV